MPAPLVIDISHHQPDPIDWLGLVSAGIVGVIHKATEGTGYKDPKLFARASAAMNTGLLWSTYHFLRPGNMGAQMDWYLNTINPVGGERVCLDHEDGGVSLSSLRDCVNIIRSKRPDLQITIYSGHLIKEQLGSAHDVVLASTSLWIAQYSSSPSWPIATWPNYSLWQYTDQGRISGINGNVDLNQFNGSRENCIKWMSPAGSEPTPAPEPEPEEKVVRVYAPPGVRVDVIQEDE